jgi:hypothetical protein
MVPSRGTRRYYEAVEERDLRVRDYYRHFKAPGLGHCWSPSGLYPFTIFDDMVAWIERGSVPRYLLASFIMKMALSMKESCAHIQRELCIMDMETRCQGTDFCAAGTPDQLNRGDL